MSDEIKEKNIIQKSIQCLSSAKLETTYEVARDIVLDYITNLQQENDRLNNIINELEEYCKEEYYRKNTTDIDSIGLSNNIYVCIYMKIKELKENNNAKD